MPHKRNAIPTRTLSPKAKPRLPAAPRAGKPTKASTVAARATKATKTRRADQVVKMLKRKNGVSIPELTEAFNVLPHTARAMVSVFSRQAGLAAELRDGRYRLNAERVVR